MTGATPRIVATLGIAAALAGCRSHPAAIPGAVRVVAGENFWGNIAAQIGGRHVQVTSILTSPTADPHLYESDVANAVAVAEAGLTHLPRIVTGFPLAAVLAMADRPGTSQPRLDGGAVQLTAGLRHSPISASGNMSVLGCRARCPGAQGGWCDDDDRAGRRRVMAGPGRGGEPQQEPLGTFPLGTVSGIRVRANWSVAIILAVIAFGLARLQFPAANPRQSPLTYALAGVITAVVFLASLLAHELAHSLVARHYGLSVTSITLWAFGGISELSGEIPDPAAEVRVAAVGPLTSLLLGGIFIGAAIGVAALHPARDSVPGVVDTALAYLGVTNVALFAFNIIPAAPLDGGRVLRAIIWWRTGDRVKATIWASRAGQVLGWIFVGGGFYAFFITGQWTWLWTAFIGIFITGAASAEAQQAVVTGRLRGIRVSQIMTPSPVTVVPASMTVSEFLGGYLFRARHQSFPVTQNGDTVTGLVTFNRIKQVPPGQRDHTRLADIACPLADVATAAPDDSAADLLPRLTACADQRALVFQDGRLMGIVSPSDITRMTDQLGQRRPGS